MAVVEGEGSLVVRVRGKGVASAGVVRAGVEAVVHDAAAVLDKYEAAHAFLPFLGGGVDRALDEAVADGNAATGVYIANQARRVA